MLKQIVYFYDDDVFICYQTMERSEKYIWILKRRTLN